MIRKWVKLTILFFILLSLDIVMKWYTVHYISKMNFLYPFYPFGGIGIFKLFDVSFSLNYVQNVGAAWGFFAAYSKFLIVFRIIIALGLLGYLIIYNKDKTRSAPLVLILTGAVGNILDFFIYRHVVDMFHFRFWGHSFPVFNFADSFITIGICWLLLSSFSWVKKKKTRHV